MSGGTPSRSRVRVAAAGALLACASAAGLGSGGATAAPAVPSVAQALKSAAAPTPQLRRGRTIDFQGTKIVQYHQQVDGVPVLGGEVAVIGDAAGSAAPRVVTDGSAAKVAAPPAATVSSSRAIAIARRTTGASGLRARPTSQLFVDPQHGNALVRRVMLASSRPLKDFQVLVDATTGEVLQKINVLHYEKPRTGKAKLYTPNPVVMNGGYRGLGSTRQADHNNRDTPKLTALRAPVSLNLLAAGQHCLKGAYVEARVGEGKGKAVCRRGLDFSKVTRSNNKFEPLEAYYEITQLQIYYHSLGFTGTSDVHPKRQVVVANAFPDDNSFYSPSDHRIRYGTGGVDDAEDGDVITHEYGHSIQDAQAPGFANCNFCQSAALGEGFGDFESAVNTAISPNVPPSYLHKAESCIFDWDGVVGWGGPRVAPCGRLATGADGTRTFPKALSTCRTPQGPEIHCLGEVWSHGLIDLLNSIPADSQGRPPIVVDTLMSQFLYKDNTDFRSAVDLLLATDDAVYGTGAPGSGANRTAICAEMKTARGIPATGCP